MPQHKNNNHTTKRKSRKRGGARSATSRPTGFSLVPSLFPPMYRTSLIYADYFVLANLGSTGVASYVFLVNSLYDPNFSGTGTTAYGISQLAQTYDRYRVLGVSIDFDVLCTTGTTGGEVFVVPTVMNALGTSLQAWHTARWSWRRAIGPPTGNCTRRGHVSFPIHKIWGVPALQVRNEDDFSSVMGNSPSNKVFLHFGWTASGTAAASTIAINIRIKFDAVFSMPKFVSP